MKPAQTIGIVILSAGIVPFSAAALIGSFVSNAARPHEPLHAFLEIAGACMAIAVAMLLGLRLQRGPSAYLVWPMAALLCMGVLDTLHGSSEPGPSWAWLRELSTLFGGLLFAMVWLPPSQAAGLRLFRPAIIAVLIAVLSGLCVLFFPAALPAAWTPHGYTLLAKLVNTIGGAGFLLAATYFLQSYQRSAGFNDLVFAAHCLLFGATAFAVWFSNVWQLGWWLWHFFRLLAYIIIVTAAYRFVRQMQHTIEEYNRELEKSVEHRTLELAAKNTLLAAEIQERQQIELALRQSDARLHQVNEALEARVTERTAELREMVTQLDSFSYSLVHDLRAPLRAMNAFAKILDEEYRPRLDDRAARYLSRIGSAAARMDHLIQDVLSYTRVTRDEVKIEEVDLHSLLNDIIHQYPDLEEHAPRIVVDCASTIVHGNTAFLTQTFSNLLRNAVKFVPPGTLPRVRVWSENGEDCIRICVRDNGIGIPADKHAQIFGVFQRLHGEDAYPGTGIGLAIVKRSIERMKGRIRVESELGQGSAFWVELPRHEKAPV